MRNLARVSTGIFAIILATALAACSGLSLFVANAPARFGPLQRASDLAYGPNARERLDVFSPTGAVGRPIVIFFYGGSWTTGRKANYAFVGAALAAQGFVTVIPDYRLYPEVRFPELIDDGARAVAWVQQHAGEFGGDPGRLVLMGHSAGAHMAALLALNDTYLAKAGLRPHTITGLVGLSGPYALAPNTVILHTIFASPYTEADWQPVAFASTRSPPTLLLHGLDDSLVYAMHTKKLETALLSKGVPVETHFYPKRGHADTIASFSLVARRRTPALKQTIEFLQRVTARNGSLQQGL